MLASTPSRSNSTVQKPAQYRAATPEESEEEPGIVVKTNNEGDKYVDLGRKRRATVRAFKGMNPLHLASAYAVTDDLLSHPTGKPLLDIREYYGQEGDENPGKKGIALNQEEVRIKHSFIFAAAHTTVVGETQS